MKTRQRLVVAILSPDITRGRLWRQVSEFLAWEIAMGRLQPGDRVPATRTLARELGVSRNTVALAYDELISLGYFTARVGDGSYVAKDVWRLRPRLFQRRWDPCADPEGNRLMLIR